MSAMKMFGWGVLGLVGIGALTIVGNVVSTGVKVATAPGRVINKTLETDNIISNYEFFRDANQQFEARVAQAKAHKKILAEETNASEKSRLRIEVAAIQQSCRDLAAKYNANASKMNRNIFRADAPDSLSPTLCE